jgi:uncharacterized protein YndB with AHSA1/START domain
MNTQTTMPPVRKTVTVKQPQDQAFALFTGRIAQWWPGGGVPGGDPGARPGTVVLEPRPQGKIYRRHDDGSIEFWGEVQVWEPPHRLVLVWQPARPSPPLILGITSVVVPILGILAAPFAIVFGIPGRRRAREGARQGGLATAGLTLGAIGFVLWGVLIVGGALVISSTYVDGEEEQVPVEPVPTGQVGD